MRKRTGTLSKRILCWILCLAMILPGITIPTFAAASQQSASSDATGTEPYVSTESSSIGGVTYNINRTTRYVGNRTYEIQIELSSSMSVKDYALNREYAQNGYFTVQKDGWYLLELWGGTGSDGQDTIQLSLGIIPGLYPGGDGGASGYVYAKVYLLAGQTLVWSIGTHGEQSQTFDDAGGGANGDGGTHGDQGMYTVGGGGGYSVIYLLEEGDGFQSSWVTNTSINIPEPLRLTRYLLIAGGGGGGGAGCGSILINGDVQEPDGGNGGRVRATGGIDLTQGGYDVPGYVFAGSDGSSSGTSTAYVGRGGTAVPGQVNETWLANTDSSKAPNDWADLANPAAAPGAGGSGNLRGGGGGAGYAGGSGGIMASALSAAHVGGGGGGSSFIAASANGKDIEFRSLTSEENGFLLGFGNKPTMQGGAAHVTYLGEEGLDVGALEDSVTLSTKISKYFDIRSASALLKDGSSSSVLIGKLGEGDTFSVSDPQNGYVTLTAQGLSIRPETVSEGQTTTVIIRVKAKETFVGGNNVEMVESSANGVVMTFIRPDNLEEGSLSSDHNANKSHNYVNVPLSTKMVTYSYTTSNRKKTYKISDLYDDSYAGLRTAISNKTAGEDYDYISSIGTYSIKNLQTNTTYTSTDTEENTTQLSLTDTGVTRFRYTVSYTVTLTSEAWDTTTVGPAIPQTTTVSETPSINIVAVNTAEFDELTVTGSKALSYTGENYEFSVTVDQTTNEILLPATAETVTYTSDAEASWEAPTDGWYLFQIWGGNGGYSGTATIYGVYNTDAESESKSVGRGSGGNGGYIYGAVYLAKGDTIDYTLGKVGSTGGNTSARLSSTGYKNYRNLGSGVGGGGYASTLIYNDTVLLIAGGGGGAGSSSLTVAEGSADENLYSDTATRTGNPSTETSNVLNTAYPFTSTDSPYRGGNGKSNHSGSCSVFIVPIPSATAGGAGSGGTSYYNTALDGGYDTTGTALELSNTARLYMEEIAAENSSKGSDLNGRMTVTLLESADSASQLEKLYNISVSGTISRYFDISNIEMTSLQSASKVSTSSVENGDGTTTVTKINYNDSDGDSVVDEGEEISRFSYKIVVDPATQTSEWQVFDTDYIPEVANITDTTMQYTTSLIFSLTLIPKEGFLGGNDVPVLVYDGTREIDADNRVYNGVRINQKNSETDEIYFMNLAAQGPTDFANVAMSYDLLEIFSVEDRTVRLGDSVNTSDLYTFTPPTYEGEDAWKAEFVEFQAPTEETYSPTQTTVYTPTAKLAPKNAAEKAVIVAGLEALECALPATVWVEIPVTYSLTNISPGGVEWILYGTPLDTKLTPDTGYALPPALTVTQTNDPSTAVDHDWNAESGALYIQSVEVPLTVEATAEVKTYKAFLVYPQSFGSTTAITEEICTLEAGASLDAVWARAAEVKAEADAQLVGIEGYAFEWQSDVDDPSTSEVEHRQVMPAYNLYITGSYERLLCALTIHYVYTDSTEAAPDYNGNVLFGNPYSVPSPILDGYTADQPIVSGLMNAGTVTITVTYTKAEGMLTILYVKPDGSTAAPMHQESVGTGNPYSVTSPSVDGYSLLNSEQQVISGTMTEAGLTIQVDYVPNRYQVYFTYAYGAGSYGGDDRLKDIDFSAATISGDSPRTVEFDKPYTYNPLTEKYDGLPTPQIAGYTFAGWYTDAALTSAFDSDPGTTVVGEEMLDLAEGEQFTLYAKWEPTSFTLMVEFALDYVDGDFLPDLDGDGEAETEEEILALFASSYNTTQSVPFGTAVLLHYGDLTAQEGQLCIQMPQLTGYTAYIYYNSATQESIATDGTPYEFSMPGQHRRVLITFSINYYDITFRDEPHTNVIYSDADTSTVADDAFSTTWKVLSVKHNETPLYDYASYTTPNKSAREAYSYVFLGWSESSETEQSSISVSHAYEKGVTSSHSFAVATGDATYYTCYRASENILSIKLSTNYVTYYTNVADAIKYAETNMASAPVMTFRRNSGNGSVIDLDVYGRMVFGNTYTTQTARTVTVNLNGMTLTSTTGPALENTISSYISVTFSTSNGTITVGGEDISGDVTAMRIGANTLTLSSSVTVQAISKDGKAVAVEQLGAATLSMSNATAALYAKGESAYGVESTAGTGILSMTYGLINAEGVEAAYGAYDLLSVAVSNTSGITVTASGEDALACGIYGSTGGTLGSSTNTKITVSAPSGTGYGVIALGSRSLSNLNLTVNARNAIGVQVREGGTLTLSNSGTRLNVTGSDSAIGVQIQSGGALTNTVTLTTAIAVTATNGNTYGVYNEGTVNSLYSPLNVEASGDTYGVYNAGSVTSLSNTVTATSTHNNNAYGIYNEGSISALSVTLTATAQGSGNAYGFYNAGGTVTASGVSKLTVNATSTGGSGYGLYGDGGSFGQSGEDESTYLGVGVIAGSTYGIYSTDGNLYVRGYELYFKGSSEANALEGATIFTGFFEAPVPDSDTAHAGYYRLGINVTLTFVTNGGTEIESITAINGSKITAPSNPTKAGYNFAAWCSDEALGTSASVPTVMPNQDTTLYAKWSLITYRYTFSDGSGESSGSSVTIVYHWNKPYLQKHYSSNSAEYSSLPDICDPTTNNVLDLTFVAPNDKEKIYIHRGWYTSSLTVNQSTYVSLSDDLSHLADSNGEVHLYAGWKRLAASVAVHGFDIDGTDIQTVSGGRHYVYYVAPKAGTYKITVKVGSSGTPGKLYGLVFKHNDSSITSTAIYNPNGKELSYPSGSGTPVSMVNGSTYTVTTSQCVAGDVIALMFNDSNVNVNVSISDYSNGGISALPQPTVPGNGSGSSNPVFTYNVEMGENGVVTLPMAEYDETYTAATHRFAGWKSETSPILMQLTPELIAQLPEWQDSSNLETLVLDPQWESRIWNAYISDSRDFSAFTTTDEVTVKDNATLSVRFVQVAASAQAMTLKLAKGLPVGTVLTLIDRSGALPVYYTYTVTDASAAQIPLTSFVRMDTKEAFVAGYSSDMIVQICYTNADVKLSSDEIGLYDADDATPQAGHAYGLIDTAPTESTASDATFDYETVHTVNLTLPDLSGKSFGANDRVYLVIRWEDGLSMASGASFTVADYTTTLYGDAFAITSLGRVSETIASTALTLTVDLSTMRQNEFNGRSFCYEICVVPETYAEKTFFGTQMQTVMRVTQSVTLTETPYVGTANTSVQRLTAGDTLRLDRIVIDGEAVDSTNTDLTLFLYQMVDTDVARGLMVTEACTTLFDSSAGLSVTENGLMASDGSLPINGGTFEALISADATPGTYYLYLVLGNKTIPLKFTVSAASQEAS